MCDLALWETEVGNGCQVWDQPELYGQFRETVGCIVKPCFKNMK